MWQFHQINLQLFNITNKRVASVENEISFHRQGKQISRIGFACFKHKNLYLPELLIMQATVRQQ